ncbi:MAG: DMT family transporter [Candidatus Sumerlaeaceae bacterium]|nr:DMT family transporter [Candidatus Sumerlaeaceae bacterium]
MTSEIQHIPFWKHRMILTLFIFCCTAALGFTGQTLIKAGLNQVQVANHSGFDWMLHAYTNLRVIAGGLLVGIGFLLWIAVLSRLDLSQAMPMLAITYVPWLIIARVALKENVTLAQWVGVVLISVGVYLVLRK